MATPNWDILHLRFASSIRDAVSAATVDGQELTVVDRDGYLNYGYSKFLNLLGTKNPDGIDEVVPELFQIASVVATSGVIPRPNDFGYYVDMASADAGVVITKVDAKEWLNILGTSTLQSPPSTTNIYIVQTQTQFNILPANTSGSFYLSYITAQGTLTQNGATDLILDEINFEPVIQLARAHYYRDKQEFSLAQAIEQDSVISGLLQ